MIASDVLKGYFLQELGALREDSTRFGAEYPVAAGQLALNRGKSKDPQVEVLLQSFAFLTGQLRYSMDCQDALLPGQLLEALSPQLSSPQPSVAVLQVEVGAGDANFAKLNQVPTGSELNTDARWKGEPRPCRFTTTDSVDLWPISVAAVEPVSLSSLPLNIVPAEADSALCIRLRSHGPNFFEMPIGGLRFFLGGPNQYPLYDALSCRVLSVATAAPGHEHPEALPRARWESGPCARNQARSLSTQPNAQSAEAYPGLALLREYFAGPERYLFFHLYNLDLGSAADEVELLLFLSGDCPSVQVEDLHLGCVPLVNLYRQRIEPIVLQPGRVDYPLAGDHYRESTCEVHSLRSLSLHDGDGREVELLPLYGSEEPEDSASNAYWSLRREVSQLPSIPGTQVSLSFLDNEFLPTLTEGGIVGGSAWCSDRRLPESLNIGDRLSFASGSGAMAGALVTEPSAPHTPALDGDSVRRLCAQLSEGCLPLEGGRAGLERLKQVLRQHFEPNNARARQQLTGLVALDQERMAERTGREAWHGLTTGVQLTLTVDRTKFPETSALLLGDVLSECFAGFAPLNGFVRLRMVDIGGEFVKLWPARSRMEAS